MLMIQNNWPRVEAVGALWVLGLHPSRVSRTVLGCVLLKPPKILIRAPTTGGYKLGFEPDKGEGQ